MRIVKFIVSGAAGMAVNLCGYFVLHLLGAPYLAGSIGGFLAAVFVGFTLQKHWTFENREVGSARTQFMLYALFSLGNLALNTGIVYVLVGRFGVYYLLAQTVGAAVVAIDGFFLYRTFVFNPLRA
ncbi:MAG: GtrA family protein [Minisyncoccia bacterium]